MKTSIHKIIILYWAVATIYEKILQFSFKEAVVLICFVQVETLLQKLQLAADGLLLQSSSLCMCWW